MNVHLKIPDIRDMQCNCEKYNSQSMENIRLTAPLLKLHAYISGLQIGVSMEEKTKKKRWKHHPLLKKKFQFCLKTCFAPSIVTVCFIQLLFRVKFINSSGMGILIFSLTKKTALFSNFNSWVSSNQLSFLPSDLIAFFYKVCNFILLPYVVGIKQIKQGTDLLKCFLFQLFCFSQNN